MDDARVYGGIHWRFDQDAGSVLGRAIAMRWSRTTSGRA